MGRYEYLEDEAIADVAFRAHGSTLAELFYQAAMATARLQTDLSLLEPTHSIDLDISKSTLDRLLKAFLGEILFYKDADLIFATNFDVNIQEVDTGYRLVGTMSGADFDYEKHPMHNDLKAITWHNLYVEKKGDEWECYVLIDI
ncbi:MAG: archease [Candidatus Kariarchaeaceae archaeon]|jgi:SHS2 domain-containing protein